MSGIGKFFPDGGAPGAGSAEWHLQRPNEWDREILFGWRRAGRGIGRMALAAAE
jgi:hypothetical protein